MQFSYEKSSYVTNTESTMLTMCKHINKIKLKVQIKYFWLLYLIVNIIV